MMIGKLSHAWTIVLVLAIIIGEKVALGANGGVRKSSSSPSSPVVINEIYYDGVTILDVEFIELYGPPNHSLKGLSFVVVDSTSKAQPDIMFRLDFNRNHTLGCNGFFLVGNPQVQVVKGVTPDLLIEPAAWSDGTTLTVALVETRSLKQTQRRLTGKERGHSAVGIASGLAGKPKFHFQAPSLRQDYPVGFTRRPRGSDTLVPYTAFDEAKTTPRAATRPPCSAQGNPASSTETTTESNTAESTMTSDGEKHCAAVKEEEQADRSNPATIATAV